MPTRPRLLLTALALTLLCTATVGCSGTSSAAIRANPSPELYTSARTFDQHLNAQARTFDVNERSGLDDLNRLFLLDRPRRLTPYPVP